MLLHGQDIIAYPSQQVDKKEGGKLRSSSIKSLSRLLKVTFGNTKEGNVKNKMKDR